MSITVIKIVAEHLRAGGFDGLVCGAAECGCLLEDLHPCSEDFSQCEPGYRHDDPNEAGGWIVSTSRTPPAAADKGS